MDFLNDLALKWPWLPLAWLLYLQFAKFVVGVRDAIDRTPLIDDNWFERIATIVAKTIAYQFGVRPKANEEVKAKLGPIANAVGVNVTTKLEEAGETLTGKVPLKDPKIPDGPRQ